MFLSINVDTQINYVFKILSAWTLTPLSPQELHFTIQNMISPEYRTSTQQIVKAITESVFTLDSVIQQTSPTRKFTRFSTNEKAILRIGTWQLLNNSNIASKTVIRQCVELASAYTFDPVPQWINATMETIATICRPTAIPSQEVLHV